MHAHGRALCYILQELLKHIDAGRERLEELWAAYQQGEAELKQVGPAQADVTLLPD